MSDAKESKKGERLEPVPDRVSSPDAQAARAAGAGDMASVEKQRSNASDGSLQRYNPENLAAQQHSIELVYEGRTASRTEKKTERELLREMANKPENSTTQDLESIAKDKSLPEDKRTLAGMIQEMRTQSKALGTPTDALDAYAREALQAELLAKSKTQLPQSDDQDSCGSFSYTDAKKGMTIGSHTYAADQLIAQGDVQSPVVSDATNARANDVPHERTLLFGHVSEPDPWDKVAALPEKTQAEIVLTAIRANAENWGREQVQRQIGALIGTTEGIGQILQDVTKITDFSHACLVGDQETVAKMSGEFRDSIGRTLAGGVNVLKVSDAYLQDLGAQGDWTKPAKDIAHFSIYLNQKWDQLPPLEQERFKYRLITELAAGAALGGTGTAAIGKAKNLTQVLDAFAVESRRLSIKALETSADLSSAAIESAKLARAKLSQGSQKAADHLSDLAAKFVKSDSMEHSFAGIGKLEKLRNAEEPVRETILERRKFVSRLDPSHRLTPIQAARENAHINGKDFKENEWKKLSPQEKSKQLKEDGYKEILEYEKPVNIKAIESELDLLKNAPIEPIAKDKGLEIANRLRSAMQYKGGNVAIAHSSIDGQIQSFAAISGEVSPTGTVLTTTKRLLPYREISGAQTRAFDAELKIMEQLARGLTKESNGVVNLYTEMLPCDSCAPMIEKFREDFPLVTVNVTYSKLPLRLPKGFRK